MATSGNTRTAYLVVTHPDTGAVKDVLTITQAQMAPVTTQAPAYTFNWSGPSSISLNSTTNTSAAATIYFSWDGPNLTASDFGFYVNSGNMNVTLPIVNNTSNFMTADFSSTSAGTKLATWRMNNTFGGAVSGDIDHGIELITTTSGTGGTGGNGGCLLEGTLITMMDGTSKKVEDIIVGDVVKSISIQGLSEDEDAWKTWSTNTDNFVSSNISTNITGLATEVFSKYYTFGFGDQVLHVTGEHPILIKKEDNTILFQQVRNIQVGDAIRVFSSNSWAIITSIDITTDNTIPTYNLSAEDADVYVAGGIIVHNVVDLDKDDGYGDDYGDADYDPSDNFNRL
jgi:hypothetical protein